jgi:predicted RNA-binding Zn ribbon-like protein
MQLDHDSALALEELTLIVNDEDHDVLADPNALDGFLDARGISGSRAGDDKELAAMRRLRKRLRSVFALAADNDKDAVIDAVNALIADARATPRLVEHDGIAPHLHYTPPDAPLDQRLAAEVGIALAIVVRDHGLDRLRICAAPDCENVLVDLSKNRSRRFCSTQCANRQHVAAYRRRQAEAG